MTMTLDHPNNRHLGPMGFDNHMPYGNGPQFTNPWTSATSNNGLFPNPINAPNNAAINNNNGNNHNHTGYDALAKQQAPRATTTSLPYSSIPASAPPIAAGTGYPPAPYGQPEMVNLSQDLLNHARPAYDQAYSGAPSSVGPYAPTSAPYSTAYGTVAQHHQPQPQPQHQQSEEVRRLSHSSSVSSSSQPQTSFTDALDASRGMVALSQDMTTPRNIYGLPPRNDRGSTDGYGFPASHSAHSSISSASYNPSYYSGSVDSSVSDYGSASDMESVNSRTLPRPSGLIGGSGLPAPQSMMSQFNSKISSSTQKKHKCKVCDKRFTRPSSLQTHMYSHTGEKPFSCEAAGCGRNFSVVSNLRRHRKVHKHDRKSDHGSPEGSWVSDK